jgi:hypothetical protein
MNSTSRRTRVSADGDGVVLHAGAAPLRETPDYTGLVAAVTAALADTYRPWLHAPGRVFVDLAVAVAANPVDRWLGERTTAATATGTWSWCCAGGPPRARFAVENGRHIMEVGFRCLPTRDLAVLGGAR